VFPTLAMILNSVDGKANPKERHASAQKSTCVVKLAKVSSKILTWKRKKYLEVALSSFTPRKHIQYKHDIFGAVTLRKICFLESFERRVTRVVWTSCRVLKALQRKYCITKNYDALRVEIGLQIHFLLRREETAGNMFVTCTRYASFPGLSLSRS